MKKVLALCIGILIVSNVIWGWLYADKNKGVQAVHLYVLDGSGNMWDVQDYKILVFQDRILRGDAKLIYKGNPDDVDEMEQYSYRFKERVGDTEESVFSVRAGSHGASLFTNVQRTGTITSDKEPDSDRSRYLSTTLTITWKDNHGTRHTETIDLELARELTLESETR